MAGMSAPSGRGGIGMAIPGISAIACADAAPGMATANAAAHRIAIIRNLLSLARVTRRDAPAAIS
jgi:hypothetical protein